MDSPFPVTDIMQVLATFRTENERLTHIISEQRMAISSLTRRLGSKDREILELKRELKVAHEKLSQCFDTAQQPYEKPTKDSHNSSIPPSKEPIRSNALRRTISLRKKSDRKSGGQPGHPGCTLEQTPSPDHTIEHVPQYCVQCGVPLSDASSECLGVRQVVDLPKIKSIVTEHRIYGKRCSCGCINKEIFPAEARSPVCYGPNIRSYISYFNTVQCIPYQRLDEVFKDCFGVNFSQGTIYNILKSMKQKSDGVYGEIRSRITQSPVVGADETGANVGSELDWIWGFQTDKLTYLFHDPTRSQNAINKHFPDGLPHATLVTDRYAAYFSLPVKDHQICLAHLLRELTYLSEFDQHQDWSSRLKALFQEAIHKRKTMEWENIPREELLERLDDLLTEPIFKLHKDFGCLQRSLLKHRDNIFRFLSNPNIPYDNNATERAIRVVKIKQKVSGCFRSDEGADIYAQLLSIADTAKKNGKSRFKAFSMIARE